VICALGHGAHMLYFATVNHGKFPFFSKAGLYFLRLWIYFFGKPRFSAYIIHGRYAKVNQSVRKVMFFYWEAPKRK